MIALTDCDRQLLWQKENWHAADNRNTSNPISEKANFSEQDFFFISFILLCFCTSRSFCGPMCLQFWICLRWKIAEALFSPFDEYWYDSGLSVACFAKKGKSGAYLLTYLQLLSLCFGSGVWFSWNGELRPFGISVGYKVSSFLFLWVYPGSLFWEKFGFPTLALDQRMCCNTGNYIRRYQSIFAPLSKGELSSWLATLLNPASRGRLFQPWQPRWFNTSSSLSALSRTIYPRWRLPHDSKWCHFN